jgi:large subunit ribosomal protein L13
MDEIIIDAENTVAGRLASAVASELLKGKTVKIANAEKSVISGEPSHIVKSFKEKRERGDPYHGPFYPREPDMILKRIIRGMVPRKVQKGREALKRVRVYISVPEELKGREFTKIKGTENSLRCKTMSIGELAVKLGAKKTW